MNALIIGGTGIIGKELCKKLSLKYNVVVISNKKIKFFENIKHIFANVNDYDSYKNIIEKLNNKYKAWDVVIDIIQFSVMNSKTTLNLFRKNTNHIIVFSTALVYDVAKKEFGTAVSEQHPLSEKGVLGGYVDSKIDIELFWKHSDFLEWTILRPYHIIGSGSNLGCLPFHNRDKNIINKIKAGTPLKLINIKDSKLSFIHPIDIAVQISLIANNSDSFGEAYNLAFNNPTTHNEYFNIIGKSLKVDVIIDHYSIHELIDSNYGWEMTAMEHFYSINKLYELTKVLPSNNLKKCLSDAINYINDYEDSSLMGLEVHSRMNKPPRPNVNYIFKKHITHMVSAKVTT